MSDVDASMESETVFLGDKAVQMADLKKYWEIIGADTDEKKAWNIPTKEQMEKTLREHLDNEASTLPRAAKKPRF